MNTAAIDTYLLENATLIRLAVAMTFFTVLVIFQRIAPMRADATLRRWWVNLGMIAVSTALTRLLLPLGVTGVAIWAQAQRIGLSNQITLPPALAFVLVLVVFDFTIYWQHRAFHTFAPLWRAHRPHHTDTGFDVSLGLRFHPFEIVLSTLFKFAVVLVLGAAPAAVLIYELILLAMSLFTHADVKLPVRVDGVLRWLIVTPDWHRVHHSVHRAETDSNYGNWLSFWDRLFGSYIPQPRDGHRGMRIGLPQFRESAEQTLLATLASPARSTATVSENPHA